VTWVLTILRAIGALFGYAQAREENKRLDAARRAGADEAARQGSEEVDQVLLDAERAKGQISHTEADIVNDPRNRARSS